VSHGDLQFTSRRSSSNARNAPAAVVGSLAYARRSTSCLTSRMAGGWVHVMTNRRNGTLSVGSPTGAVPDDTNDTQIQSL
jgi:hypothetical protein